MLRSNGIDSDHETAQHLQQLGNAVISFTLVSHLVLRQYHIVGVGQALTICTMAFSPACREQADAAARANLRSEIS